MILESLFLIAVVFRDLEILSENNRINLSTTTCRADSNSIRCQVEIELRFQNRSLHTFHQERSENHVLHVLKDVQDYLFREYLQGPLAGEFEIFSRSVEDNITHQLIYGS